MESSFASRIRQFRQEKNLSQQAFAERCGLTQGNVTHMEGGKEPLQSNVAKLLSGFPDLSPDWLLLGTGSMLRNDIELTPLSTRLGAQSIEKATPVDERPQPDPPTATALHINREGEDDSYWKGLAQERLRENEFLKELLRGAYGIRPADEHEAEPAREGLPKKAVGSEHAAEPVATRMELVGHFNAEVTGFRRYPATCPERLHWVEDALNTPLATQIGQMWLAQG